MPSLTFVLPHWLYWLTLILLPLTVMLLLRLTRGQEQVASASKPVAYFLLLTGGFVGCHRFYLKSPLGLVYVPLFVGILLCNIEGREARNVLSLASNEVVSAEFRIGRFQSQLDKGKAGAAERLNSAEKALHRAEKTLLGATEQQQRWDGYSQLLAGLTLLLLAVDACLLPGLCYRYRQKHPVESTREPLIACEEISDRVPRDKEKPPVSLPLTELIEKVNQFCGQFVAYWSLIAVFFYYYEVIARYLFNSPTNWAHESMFLMFGMQYLIAGGYVMRNNGHVRVDVLYMHFSPRTKALVDVTTSLFFFIFAVTLLWTGWTFFSDSFAVREVSFTEWGIQYWPVKFALPLGAGLILLQGVAWLIKDLLILRDTAGGR